MQKLYTITQGSKLFTDQRLRDNIKTKDSEYEKLKKSLPCMDKSLNISFSEHEKYKKGV